MRNGIPCPVLGQSYHYFDDGKIRLSRRLDVEITSIIPFNEIDSETLLSWETEVNQCRWLYAKNTDYFVKGSLDTGDNEIKEIIFVRCIYNGWFSLGWWAGRLDTDGTLNATLEEEL